MENINLIKANQIKNLALIDEIWWIPLLIIKFSPHKIDIYKWLSTSTNTENSQQKLHDKNFFIPKMHVLRWKLLLTCRIFL